MAFSAGIVDALHPSRLRLLVELERRGSISAAAEACHVSQPSASKHIKSLEAALGEQLVEREGRSVRLTEAGSIIAAGAAEMLDVIRATGEELTALRTTARGSLHVAASTTAGAYVLPSILGCFAEQHPRVDVDVSIGSSASVAERLLRREASFGIAGEAALGPGLEAELFLEDRLVAVAAPGQVKTERGKVVLDELSAKTLLVREQGSSTRLLWDRHLAQAGLGSHKRWEFDSSEAIKQAAKAGLGVGLLTGRVVADELERGDLLSFEIAGIAPTTESIFLLRSARTQLTVAERAFVATLNDCCATSVSGCAVRREEDQTVALA